MTRSEQRRFIRSITKSVKEEILKKINAGRIPEEWDGHELRELLYDKFAFERTSVMSGRRGYRSSRRVKAYRNAVYTNNL